MSESVHLGENTTQYICTIYGWFSGIEVEEVHEPIVRCRDCKHYQSDDMYGSICVHINDGKYEQWEVEPNGFCAWGERNK